MKAAVYAFCLLVVVVSTTSAAPQIVDTYDERPSDQEVLRQARLRGLLPADADVQGIFPAQDQGGYVYSDGNGPALPLAEQIQEKLTPEELKQGQYSVNFIRY